MSVSSLLRHYSYYIRAISMISIIGDYNYVKLVKTYNHLVDYELLISLNYHLFIRVFICIPYGTVYDLLRTVRLISDLPLTTVTILLFVVTRLLLSLSVNILS